MHQVMLLQTLAHLLVIGGFILMFTFRRHLLLNSYTPSTGKTLGYFGALLLLSGLLVQLVILFYSYLNL